MSFARCVVRLVFVLVSLLATCAIGCESPDRTVTLNLRGVDNQRTWQLLQTIIPKLADGGTYSGMSCSGPWASGEGSISVGPVTDVKEFARRIRFGKVERIHGRTIDVQVSPTSVRLDAWLMEAARFVRFTRRLLLDEPLEGSAR